MLRLNKLNLTFNKYMFEGFFDPKKKKYKYKEANKLNCNSNPLKSKN